MIMTIITTWISTRHEDLPRRVTDLELLLVRRRRCAQASGVDRHVVGARQEFSAHSGPRLCPKLADVALRLPCTSA